MALPLASGGRCNLSFWWKTWWTIVTLGVLAFVKGIPAHSPYTSQNSPFRSQQYRPQYGPPGTCLELCIEPNNWDDISSQLLYLAVAGLPLDTKRVDLPHGYDEDSTAISGRKSILLRADIIQLDMAGFTPADCQPLKLDEFGNMLSWYSIYQLSVSLVTEHYGSLLFGNFRYHDVNNIEFSQDFGTVSSFSVQSPSCVDPLPPPPPPLPDYIETYQQYFPDPTDSPQQLDDKDIKTCGGILPEEEKDELPAMAPMDPFHTPSLTHSPYAYGGQQPYSDLAPPDTPGASTDSDYYLDDDQYHPSPNLLMQHHPWWSPLADTSSANQDWGSAPVAHNNASSSSSAAAAATQDFTPSMIIFDDSLEDMADTSTWTPMERTNKRRLVKLDRSPDSNEPQKIRFTFTPFSQTAQINKEVVVSCIMWDHGHRQGCYITSVDVLYLLESIMLKSIEEKNRIRRNIENLGPTTISKNKQDTATFFAQIMVTSPHPKVPLLL
ncbi:hypothetical protein HK097_002732 [Rhizophlyctis rosea]|uniref:DUF7082 domain-containing protein n=1 Tax=Rhizophlyctis rosea TaxID=64517 RepID=A0AAD5S4X8_9FUNG|nr:hypothetical protein HK097_002732 [Rhizophlyctis rosea]